MPWVSKLVEVKPDGAKVYKIYYQYEINSNIYALYLKPVICPKCKEKGYLYALYTRLKGRWVLRGFMVKHLKNFFDKEEYNKLRQRGVSAHLANERATVRRVVKQCWLGKFTSLIEGMNIPTPEDLLRREMDE